MKSSAEFRVEVYEKRIQKLAARKKQKRLTLLCVPLALLVAVGGTFAAFRLTDAPALSKSSIPLALQVGKPAAVNNDFWSIAKDSMDAKYKEQDEAYWSSLDKAYAEEESKSFISRDFQAALNDFARDSTPLLAESFGENDCYCPLSLYYALALAGSGANGETEREFSALLGLSDQELSEQCGRFYLQHYSEKEFATFQLANSLWMDGRCTFRDDYIDNASRQFFASLFQADFTDPAVGKEMGKWVSENTGGLLNPELKPDPDTMLAILNTVYLNARWGDEFLESNNVQEDFFKADGSVVTAEFMRQTDELGGAIRGEGFTRASRSLLGDMEMIFILPDEGVTPQELLSDPAVFEQMFYPQPEEAYSGCEIHWSIPKFSFDSSFDLTDPLPAMGLQTACDPLAADFSDLSKDRALYLSQAQQGVHIAIDEEGVEAAAYTELAMTEGAAMPEERPILEMKLNRPFLFAIVSLDRTDDSDDFRYDGSSVIFVGVCGNPTV